MRKTEFTKTTYRVATMIKTGTINGSRADVEFEAVMVKWEKHN